MVDSVMVSSPGNAEAKDSQTMTLPTVCFTVYNFCVLECCICLMTNISLVLVFKSYNFGPICSKSPGICLHFLWETGLTFCYIQTALCKLGVCVSPTSSHESVPELELSKANQEELKEEQVL
ncbi:hypothetical protein AMECASPLE_034039 [Ameca splendens]|uniref:Uncharacterized protein n=1 Tax=Ameca splendens TaxID=208324 RepID=A0ABV0YU21_9TELE